MDLILLKILFNCIYKASCIDKYLLSYSLFVGGIEHVVSLVFKGWTIFPTLLPYSWHSVDCLYLHFYFTLTFIDYRFLLVLIVSRHREVDSAGTVLIFKKGFKNTCNPGTGAAGINQGGSRLSVDSWWVWVQLGMHKTVSKKERERENSEQIECSV